MSKHLYSEKECNEQFVHTDGYSYFCALEAGHEGEHTTLFIDADFTPDPNADFDSYVKFDDSEGPF